MALRLSDFLRSLAASACAATIFGSAALADEPTPLAPPAPSVAEEYAIQPGGNHHDHSVAGSHGWTGHHQPQCQSYCYEDCWPQVPNMIGDVCYGSFGNGSGGITRMTNFVGFSDGMGNSIAAEIIPLTATNPNATFQSAFINEAFVSLNPNTGFTNQTIIALQQNTELLNLARARFGNVTFIGGQAVPLGLANQVPALANGMVAPLTVNGMTVQTLQGTPGINATNFPGSVFNQDLVVNPGGTPIAVNDSFIILNTLDFLGGGNGLFLPAPGGPTHFAKVSHNNSPLPQDRVFFNYDFLDTTINSLDVNYYVFGVEKTFMDGQFSIQVDIPFFDGPDSDVSSIGATDVEFGNIPVWLKALVHKSQNMAISAGVGINTPTASDVDLFMGGQQLLRVRNNSAHILPFVAGIYRPSRNLFFQSFAQIDYDLSGNEVLVNNGGNLTGIGELDAQTLFHLDVGMGYMLYENQDSSMLKTITPMVELHYTTDLDSADVVQTGMTPISTLPQYDILNVTGGANVQLNDRANLNLGIGAPLTDDGPGDRAYDWRATLQLNIQLGNN